MDWLIVGAVVWTVVVAALVGLIVQHQFLRSKADETVTLVPGQAASGKPEAYARRADQVKRWIVILAAVEAALIISLVLYWLR